MLQRLQSVCHLTTGEMRDSEIVREGWRDEMDIVCERERETVYAPSMSSLALSLFLSVSLFYLSLSFPVFLSRSVPIALRKVERPSPSPPPSPPPTPPPPPPAAAPPHSNFRRVPSSSPPSQIPLQDFRLWEHDRENE